jgi:hypothetical protein
MKWIHDNYQANDISKSARKGVEYMDQWIDPLHQLLVARFFKGLGLIPKNVQDSVSGPAGLQLIGKPMGKKVIPRLLFVLDQGGIKHGCEVRGGGCHLGGRTLGHIA